MILADIFEVAASVQPQQGDLGSQGEPIALE
jgi:hypothetical protein